MNYHFTLFFLIILLATSCSDLHKLFKQASIKNPDVKIIKTQVSALSFEQADLLFDIEVHNPNDIGISLSGFDYDLLLNNTPFLKGDQSRKIEIKADDKTMVQIPLSLDIKHLVDTYKRLRDEDEIIYTLNSGFLFDLPIIGDVRIPVSTSGKVPMVKIPSISLRSIKLERLSLSGAEFDLQVAIGNQNSWGFDINKLVYKLSINGESWANGQSTTNQVVAAKGETRLHLPFSLSFLEVGTGVNQIISGGKNLQYGLEGKATISPSLEILGTVDVPFAVEGKIDLAR
jgi:LEA14-like dessication related protein